MKILKIIIPIFLTIVIVVLVGCAAADKRPVALDYELSDSGQIKGIVDAFSVKEDYVYVSLIPKFEGFNYYESEKLRTRGGVIQTDWMGYNGEGLVNGTYELKLEILSENDPFVIKKDVNITKGTDLVSVSDKYIKDKQMIEGIYNDLLQGFDEYQHSGDVRAWGEFGIGWNKNLKDNHEIVLTSKKGYEVAYNFLSILYLEMDGATRGEDADVESIMNVIERLMDEESVIDVFASYEENAKHVK